MTCDKIDEWLLSAYVDRELEPVQSEQVRSHLEQCQICTARAQEFQNVSDILQTTFSSITAPDGLEERIMRKIADNQQTQGIAPMMWIVVCFSLLLIIIPFLLILSPLRVVLWSVTHIGVLFSRAFYTLFTQLLSGQIWIIGGLLFIGIMIAVSSLFFMKQVLRKTATTNF